MINMFVSEEDTTKSWEIPTESEYLLRVYVPKKAEIGFKSNKQEIQRLFFKSRSYLCREDIEILGYHILPEYLVITSTQDLKGLQEFLEPDGYQVTLQNLIKEPFVFKKSRRK